MNFTSFYFMCFVAGVLVVYYGLSPRQQNYWLLCASYLFYVTWSWQIALVLFLVTMGNFVLAPYLRAHGRGRCGLLGLGIGLNIGVLAFFRASNFFLPGMLTLLSRIGLQSPADGLHILLPIGLSYYVLENISYLVDVYRGQLKASDDIVDFALYLAYFPKLLAGPIERARSFLPKLATQRTVDHERLTRSVILIVMGIARKLLLADTLAAAIHPQVFETPGLYTAPELLGWLLLYAFSLYNDFAGYTSMARGISGLFGIELSSNFQQPYFARSFTEFWNRWHITLSHWLRDYIYFPLSRYLLRRHAGRRHPLNLIVPPVITMLVSGLWHGFSWHMLIWGGLHGLYQVIERLTGLGRPTIASQQQPWWRQYVAGLAIFLLVLLAWVPFRMELPIALEYWRGLLDWSDVAIHYRRLFFAVPLLVVSIGVDWLQRCNHDEYVVLRWPRPVQASLVAIVAFIVLIVVQGDAGTAFVYQGF